MCLNRKISCIVENACGWKKDSFSDLKWWIQMQKKLGFDKLHLCDHMIEKDSTFTRLLEQHKEFLEMDQLKCIPNLKNPDFPFS